MDSPLGENSRCTISKGNCENVFKHSPDSILNNRIIPSEEPQTNYFPSCDIATLDVIFLSPNLIIGTDKVSSAKSNSIFPTNNIMSDDWAIFNILFSHSVFIIKITHSS